MGYNEAMRFAFLQANGVDPIDIGILSMGRIPLPFSFHSSMDGVRLTNFPDWGMNPQGTSYNGESATKHGAKTAPMDWTKFRVAQADQVVNQLIKRLKQTHKQLPLLQERVHLIDSPTDNRWVSFTAPGPYTPVTQTVPANPVKPDKANKPAETPSTFGVTFAIPVLPRTDGEASLTATLGQKLQGYDRKPVLVDISALPLPDALSLLQTFQPR